MKGQFENSEQANKSFSFGVSREHMKKIYLQAIEKAGVEDPLPGPGNYKLPEMFGKAGIAFSLRPNTCRQ